jgi:hypothetical protein
LEFYKSAFAVFFFFIREIKDKSQRLEKGLVFKKGDEGQNSRAGERISL